MWGSIGGLTLIFSIKTRDFSPFKSLLHRPILTWNVGNVSNEIDKIGPQKIWSERVANRPIEQLTLVDKFKQADQTTRAIMDHIERGFLPKVNDLERLVRPNPDGLGQQEDVTNLRVRNYAANVISSDDFTHEQSRLLDDCLKAIDVDVARELGS